MRSKLSPDLFSLEETKALSMRWPLLRERAVERDGDKASLDCALCVKDYPFLADHRIDGKVVVPWAVAVELMAQTVQTAWSRWHILEIQNAQQLRGMVIEEGNTLSVRVTVAQKERAEPHLVKAMISSSDRAGLPYYRATFLLGREPAGPPLGPSLAATTPRTLTAKVFYGQHVFHGPSFRLLHLITGLDRSGVDATIIPAGQGWRWLEHSWIFHPGLAGYCDADWKFLDPADAQQFRAACSCRSCGAIRCLSNRQRSVAHPDPHQVLHSTVDGLQFLCCRQSGTGFFFKQRTWK